MTNRKNKPNFRLIWKISAPILFAFMPAFCKAQTQPKEKEVQKLERAIQDLENLKNHDICDSLYQVTNIDRESGKTLSDIEADIQGRIDDANTNIYVLRSYAISPIRNKYTLNEFFTPEELDCINEDIAVRVMNCLDTLDKSDQWACRYACRALMRASLEGQESVFSLENNMSLLAYIECNSHNPNYDMSKTVTQAPNKKPMVSIQKGKLSFTNPMAQELYKQYRQETDVDIEQKYIFTNPELASHYCEYSAALIKAYEERETLRKIGEFFTKKYQPQIDSLTYQLNQLKVNNR